jgi:prevent-host-death family protein
MSKLETVTFDASVAKNSFGKLIDAAQRSPVAINRRGRRVAFVISPADMEAMEDHYLGMRAMEAIRNGKSLGVRASEAYLQKLLHAKN